jgi:hypothetical protein
MRISRPSAELITFAHVVAAAGPHTGCAAQANVIVGQRLLGHTEQSSDYLRGFLALLGQSEQTLGPTEQSKLRGGVPISGRHRALTGFARPSTADR